MTQKSGSSGDSPTVDGQAAGLGNGMEISMDLDDPDLDAAIEQALAATEKRASQASKKRRNMPELPDFDLNELGDDPERSLHIFVDETEGLEDDEFDFMAASSEKEEVHHHEPDGTDGDFDFLSGLNQTATPPPAEEDSPTTGRSFDELDRELQQALDDEEEADEGDLQAEMEKLLAESFGVGAVSDDDPDLAFPDFDDEDDAEILAEDSSLTSADEEVFAAGDDGAGAVPIELQEENEALRAQVVELSRALSLRDLELRTAEDRVDNLEQQLVAAARQSAGVSREFEAFRRRSDRDKEELQKFAGEKVLKEFLGVFDNLERALAHAGEERDGPLGQGVDMTLGQFMVALRRCGAERVEGDPGTEFDPQFHEAVGQEYSDEIESGRIAHEMQAGFTLHTRLLRASMVTVSRGPLPSAEPEPEPEPEAKPKPKPKRKRKSSKRSKSSKSKSGDTGSLDAAAEAAVAAAKAEEAVTEEAPAPEPAAEAKPKAKPKRKRTRKASGSSKSKKAAEPADEPTPDGE